MKNNVLIKKRFIEKLPELKKNLGDIDEKILNLYFEALETNLRQMEIHFYLMEWGRTTTIIDKNKTAEYLSNNKIKKKLKTAMKHLVKFVLIRTEIYPLVDPDFNLVF